MKVRYRDLSVRNKSERNGILSSIEKILKSGMIIEGKEISLLEKELAEYCDRRYAIAVNSGTSALYLALKGLNVGFGDEVITTCLSVLPTANSIIEVRAKPIFVDVGGDYNINPELIPNHITEDTKAITVVNYTGKVCNMDEVMNISEDYNIPVIEDASQSFGAKWKNKISGSFGKISCFSLNPMKVLASCGEAGVILTDDRQIDDKIRKMRYNGMITKTQAMYNSLNFRMNTFQAAILLDRLKDVDENIKKRREIADYYCSNLPIEVKVPVEENDNYDTYFTYNIRCRDRDKLKFYLWKHGIETQARDSVILPYQLPNANDYNRCEFPVASEIANHSLSLPIHNHLTRKEMDYICKTIGGFYD